MQDNGLTNNKQGALSRSCLHSESPFTVAYMSQRQEGPDQSAEWSGDVVSLCHESHSVRFVSVLLIWLRTLKPSFALHCTALHRRCSVLFSSALFSSILFCSVQLASTRLGSLQLYSVLASSQGARSLLSRAPLQLDSSRVGELFDLYAPKSAFRGQQALPQSACSGRNEKRKARARRQ